MKKTFYEKVGRRYVPVAEYDSELANATRKGTNLVVTYDGGRTTYHRTGAGPYDSCWRYVF